MYLVRPVVTVEPVDVDTFFRNSEVESGIGFGWSPLSAAGHSLKHGLYYDFMFIQCIVVAIGLNIYD